MKRRRPRANRDAETEVPWPAALLAVLLIAACLYPQTVERQQEVLFRIGEDLRFSQASLDQFRLRIDVLSSHEVRANGVSVGWERMKELLSRQQSEAAAILFRSGSTMDVLARFVDEVPMRRNHWIVIESET